MFLKLIVNRPLRFPTYTAIILVWTLEREKSLGIEREACPWNEPENLLWRVPILEGTDLAQ